MGFFSIFNKKKEKIGISLKDIETWFDERTKVFYDETKIKKDEILKKISDEFSLLNSNIGILGNAQLINKDITVREIQFMEGNRDFYTKRINYFCNSITLPGDNFEDFIIKTKAEIGELGKSSAKAYSILQHFFRDETYAIAKNLKSIDSSLNELEKVIDHKKVKEAEMIKKEIVSLKDAIKRKDNLSKEIDQLKAKISDIIKEKKKISLEVSNKEQSHECKEYHRLNVEEYKANEQAEEVKAEVVHLIAVLEHGLKKYAILDPSHEKLINDYIKEPMDALIYDHKLEIIEVLEKMEATINAGKIDLKDKKKDKILETIKKMTNNYLASLLTEYNRFMVESKELHSRMHKNKVMEEINKIKENLAKKQLEQSDVNKEVSDKTKEFEAINIEEIKKNLIYRINSLLDIELYMNQE